MLSWAVLAASVLVTAPIQIDIRIYAAPSISFQCEVALYTFKMHFGGLLDVRSVFKQRRPAFSFSKAASFARSIYESATRRHLEFSCLVGTGDASLTALVAGGMGILLQHIGRGAAKISITPDFQNAVLHASGRCILRFRGGDIIIAGMRAIGGQLPKMLKGLNGNGKAEHREPDGHDDGKH